MPKRVRELRSRIYSRDESEVFKMLEEDGEEIFGMMSDFEGYGLVTFLYGKGYDINHLEQYLLRAAKKRKEQFDERVRHFG